MIAGSGGKRKNIFIMPVRIGIYIHDLYIIFSEFFIKAAHLFFSTAVFAYYCTGLFAVMCADKVVELCPFGNLIKQEIRRCADDNSGALSFKKPWKDLLFMPVPESVYRFFSGIMGVNIKQIFLKAVKLMILHTVSSSAATIAGVIIIIQG